MATTLFGVVKVFLEAQGLGIAVYKDKAPQGAAKPYVVFQGGIALRAGPREDGTLLSGEDEFQLDLYELWRDTNDKTQESPTIADAITVLLSSTQSSYGSGTGQRNVYGFLQVARSRRVDTDERLVRHIYQFDAVRTLQ